MNQEVCTLVNSIRGQPKLIVRGYLLVKDKIKDNKYYWCCEYKDARNCKGRAITYLENEEHVLKKFNEYNHAPDASRSEIVQTLNDIKEVASNNDNQPVQIIQRALTNMSLESSYSMPNKEAVRKQIHWIRSDNMPLQPQSLQDINIPDYLRRTISGDQFLARKIELESEKMLIFCTNSNLKHLYEADYWIMNGTFKTVPTLFHQLYTIHVPVGGKENSRIFLMVYVLMTSRSEEVYKKLFKEIVELGEQAGYDLSPPIIITDFE